MTDHDFDSILPPADLIDRMVDGGLMPAQLRMTVSELDKAPDGWRRCALAFLEAQCWGEALRDLDETTVGNERPTASLPRGGSPILSIAAPIATDKTPSRRWIADALAAGIAGVAFALGWMVHGLRTGGDREHPANSPFVTATTNQTPEPAAVRDSPVRSELPEPAPVSALPAGQIPTIREVARLRISAGGPAPAEVPILAGPGIDPRWVLQQPPPISGHGQAIWQREGYQLDQRRRLVSVPLGDGRRAAVPIDQVQVRYVGHEPL
jgi:hypothetical protein